MPDLTNGELAILGLILEQPRYGYEIEQVIEERGMREWTEIAFSSIYYILRKLEQKRLIQSSITQSPGKGPARKVYTVRDRGRQVWHEATRTVLSHPVGGSDPFLLGLAGLPAIQPEHSILALQQYQAALEERREHVKNNWQEAGNSLPMFLDGMFDFSVTMLESRIRWLDMFITKLEREPNAEGQYRLPL